MKRWVCPAFVMICALIGMPASAAAKQSAEEAAAAALKAKQEKEAATLLNGTVWNVEMTPLSSEKEKKLLKDTLKFEDGKITSTALAQEGYSPSNYTLTVEVGDLVIWETMQSKEGSGVAFWRGERQGETMRGILSKQPADGKNADYSFSGRVLAPPPPPPAPAAEASVPAVGTASPSGTEPPPPAPAVAPAVSAPKPAAPAPKPAEKKKKGWW